MPTLPRQRLLILVISQLLIVMMTVTTTVQIFTKYEELLFAASPLQWWSGQGSVERQSTRPKRPITIGEDCNDAETKCRYFHPVQFVSKWNHTRQERTILHRCYKNMISLYNMQCRDYLIVDDRCHGLPLSPVSAADATARLNLPLQFVYKKLYKTGGTAVDNILRHIGSPRSGSMRLKHFRPLKQSSNMTAAHDFTEHVAYKQNQGIDIPAIAVVRDPIPRFVSAVNQLVNMPGRLRKCRTLSSRADTKEIMQCAVTALVRGHKDPHFESLVADLMCNVAGRHDVQFSLYSMKDISEVLEALGSQNSTVEINSSEEKSRILSISDMDDRMIRQVCRWYAADVAMMKSLGFEVSYCE
mmetsp:Transcript_21399/g.46245  ORF Transcript_21399/g.46245 Transcript_21399/m.46245 type:complete len:357 (-) Transcript_21399:580-1650(-)